MSFWYYRTSGQPETGPLSVPELKRAFRSGDVPPDTPVRRSGSMRWVPGTAIDGLFKTPADDLPDLTAAPAEHDAPPGPAANPAAQQPPTAAPLGDGDPVPEYIPLEYLESDGMIAQPAVTPAPSGPASGPSSLPPDLDFLRPFMPAEVTPAAPAVNPAGIDSPPETALAPVEPAAQPPASGVDWSGVGRAVSDVDWAGVGRTAGGMAWTGLKWVGFAGSVLVTVLAAAGSRCRHCGEPLNEGYTVCSKCGRSSF